MSMYIKKPIPVKATRWWKNGDHPEDDVYRVLDGKKPIEPQEGAIVRRYRSPRFGGYKVCPHCSKILYEHGWIDTLEGGHIVCPGDWVLTGIHGEYYPHKPDIFEAAYDKVLGS